MNSKHKEIKATKEIDNLVNEILTKKIILHTCQILSKGGKYGYEPFGSGVFALIYERHFILTASHVVIPMLDEGLNLYVNTIDGRIPIFGDIETTDIEKSNNIDICFIKLQKDVGEIIAKTLTPISLDKINVEFDMMIKAPQYCVLGYPCKNLRNENGKIRTGASYYLLSHTKLATCNKMGVSTKKLFRSKL